MEQLIITLLKQVFSKGVSKLWDNKDMAWLYIRTIFWTYRSKQIRFSLSYLFRIKIPGTNSYLLVLNRRIANQLQPVGGVYKRYGDDKLFESWGFVPDSRQNGLGVDEKSDSDLRFRVKGKHTIDVVKWFEESKERELSGEREFCEEVLETGILDKDLFKTIKYKKIKRHGRNLKWSDFHQCYEVLIYDIFELIPSAEQGEALKALAKQPVDLSKGYAVVECEQIEQCRFQFNGAQIAKVGAHTKLIINQTF
jgi:hypothetical protein